MYYEGQGKLYAAKRAEDGSNSGFRLLGNCPAMDLVLGAGAARYAQRGTASPATAMRETGEMPEVTFTLEDAQRANLELLLHAESAATAGNTVTVEVTARKGMLVPLPHIGITAFVAVRSSDLSTTYPATGYTVNRATGSIEFAANSVIPNGATVAVTYVHSGHSAMGGYTTKQPILALRLEAVNTAEENAPFVVDIFKVRLDPLDSMTLIGDNFSQLQVSGRIYVDDTRSSNIVTGRLYQVRQL